MDNKDFLEHWGIKGMHWGRRKAPKKPIHVSPEHKAKELLKKKKLHEMTNSEIKTLNERLQLERQYKDLTRSEMSAGKKFVMDFLSTTSKQIVTTYFTKQISEIMKKVVK